jgi:calcium/calmodulin-dependent protein kinase I
MSKFVLHIKGKCLRREEERERIVGSPYYMAPEVLRGEKATEMSDWWSFGVLVYLALTGSVPFKGNVEKDLEEITKKVL